MNVHVFSFNMILLSSPQSVPRPSNPFRRNFGRSGEGSFSEKPKNSMEVPQVCQVKVHVFSFNTIILSSPERVPSPSNPFRRYFGRSGKGSFTEEAKIVN